MLRLQANDPKEGIAVGVDETVPSPHRKPDLGGILASLDTMPQYLQAYLAVGYVEPSVKAAVARFYPESTGEDSPQIVSAHIGQEITYPIVIARDLVRFLGEEVWVTHNNRTFVIPPDVVDGDLRPVVDFIDREWGQVGKGQILGSEEVRRLVYPEGEN